MIFGIGCSFTETSFGIAMPKGKTIIHSTLDPAHLNKDVEAKIGLVGDAGLVLDALLEEIGKTVTSDRDANAVAAEIAASHKEWLAKWMPKLTQQRRAAQSLSRAVGSAAHRRHQQHHHHP